MIVPPHVILAALIFIGESYSAVIRNEEISRHEELAEENNFVEPPPGIMLLSQIFDRPKSKITPQNRLKSVIKALYHYDTMRNLGQANKNKESDETFKSSESDSATESVFFTPSFIFKFPNKKIQEEEVVEGIKEPVVAPINYDLFPEIKNEKFEHLIETTSEGDSEEKLQSTETPSTDFPVESPAEASTVPYGDVLLEDIVDSIMHVPAHMEVDKAQKFTHSIRYGYGVPFHYNGL